MSATSVVFASAIALTACSLGRAAQTSPIGVAASTAAAQDGGPTIEVKEKAVVGTQHYRSSESSLQINLPYGFSANGEYTFYESDLSSRATTISVGLEKDWDKEYLGFTYSWTPLANNYRSEAATASGGYNSPSKNFKTTIGATFNATHHTEFVPSVVPDGDPQPLVPVDVWQVTGTLNLKQQIRAAKLTLDFGKSSYDHKIASLSGNISPDSTRLQGLEGLLPGFPDLEWKLGLYQNVGKWVTLWTVYDHIRFLEAEQSGHGNADSYLVGIEVFRSSRITAALQYNYLIETSEPKSTQWGLILRAKI